MSVRRAINRANSLLPGTPAAEGKKDRRWQAIIRVGDYVETNPEEVWQFVRRWGVGPSDLWMIARDGGIPRSDDRGYFLTVLRTSG